MNHTLRIIALVLITALLGNCGEVAFATSVAFSEVSLFAVNVGKGDALLLRVGAWTGLIDTGKARAMGRVARALEMLGIEHLDAVFLTHTDKDHAGGLEWLARSDIVVDMWYASAMFIGVKETKHPAVRAAAMRGQEVCWLQRGDEVQLEGGTVLRVLAPASLSEDKDNNNSLVMMLKSDQGRILLTGDMELPEEAELLSYRDDLACEVLKVANHADDDTTSDIFAQAVSAQIAVISTDSLEKPGTPDPDVICHLEAADSQVIVTQDAELGWMVSLSDGVATARAVNIDAPLTSGIFIMEVDASDDRIFLGNYSGRSIDLGGFYLHSSRGDELFTFPDNVFIAPGDTLVIGTNSTEGRLDLLWDDEKVVHKKNTDTITLYDPFGRFIDSCENGK